MKFDAEKERSTGRAASTGVIPGDVAISVGNPNLPLPDGWRWRPISEVARLESGHTPSRRHPEYWGGPIPWIGIRDATENHGRTISATAQYTNQLGIDNSSARVLPTHTVCLSRTASVGYVVVMGCPMATSQDFVNWVCGPDLDYRFLKYALLAERNSFHRFAHGSTHQTIYFPEVKAFHIAFPPRDLQARIADVLGSIDDRIEHNRALAANLEAIARALFKSWFVDFDPVRAKVAGETPPGLAPDLAALFPDRFVDSELGEIPEGWDAATLVKVCSLNPESWTGRKHPDQIEYVDLANVKAGDIENRASYSWDESPSRARRVLRSGDTIVGTVRPGNRSFALIAENGLTGSTGFAALRPNSEWLREFVYLAATSDDAIDRLTHLADGAAYPAVRPDVVVATEAVIPSEDVVKEFSAILRPLIDRVAASRSESAALTQLRDLLLPRLISGKLSVEDAEAALEAA